MYQVSASSRAGGFMFSMEPSALNATGNAETQGKSALLKSLLGFVLTSLHLTFLIPLWKPREGERELSSLLCRFASNPWDQKSGVLQPLVVAIVCLQERRHDSWFCGECKPSTLPLNPVPMEKPEKKEVVKLPWRAQQHGSTWHRER